MSYFRFKHFAVEQSDVAMKVGTDGVLLGAWAGVSGVGSVLDIGTGTGVIALMMAQRSVAERIVGVDIDEAAARCATGNFACSPWAERLSAVCCPAQEIAEGEYDLIISNPPYFSDSLLSPDVRRTTARHTTEITFEELDSTVCRLLAPQGRFALILPTERMEAFERITRLRQVRRCDVRSVPGGAIKRVMAEFAREGVGAECLRESLTIETEVRGEFSDEYRSLTKDFYLKF
ncbi:MAG: methyltransferase [Alistipes sp.]|nr:methyltransferase [Alistipes sp.]